MGHAFHQIAVAAEDVGVVVDDVEVRPVVGSTEMAFRHGHADAHGEALSERAGGGFNAIGVAELGMAGGERTQLTEALEVIERELVAAEEERTVEQGRCVAVRKDEAVAVGPFGVGRIMLHQFAIKQVGDRGATHGRAGVAALGFFYRINGQQPQRVDGKIVESLIRFAGGHRALQLFLSSVRRGV